MSSILIEYHDDVALVTLNRPEQLNAANEELHGALTKIWTELLKHDELRAAVLTGAGKAFSAGGDLQLLDKMIKDLTAKKVIAEAAEIVRAIVDFPLPIVAAVNGPAVGLGCTLAAMCDLVVMEEHAYFSDPHVMLGLVAGDGGILTWPLNIGVQRAKEWLYLGGRMSSAQAHTIGLANRVVPTGESVSEALKLAKRLAGLPPQALQETRRGLNLPLVERMATSLDDILATETRSFDTPEFQANLAAMAQRNKE